MFFFLLDSSCNSLPSNKNFPRVCAYVYVSHFRSPTTRFRAPQRSSKTSTQRSRMLSPKSTEYFRSRTRERLASPLASCLFVSPRKGSTRFTLFVSERTSVSVVGDGHSNSLFRCMYLSRAKHGRWRRERVTLQPSFSVGATCEVQGAQNCYAVERRGGVSVRDTIHILQKLNARYVQGAEDHFLGGEASSQGASQFDHHDVATCVAYAREWWPPKLV